MRFFTFLLSIVERLRKPFGPILDRLFEPWMRPTPELKRGFRDDAEFAIMQQEPVRARFLLRVSLLIILAFIVWAAIAEVDEVARGEGKVIPSLKVQLIQAVDGGVVAEISVHEGDVVDEGQLLMRLDITRAESTLNESRKQAQAVQAKYDQSVQGYELVVRELNLTRPLIAQGAVSEVEVLRLEREVSRLKGERDMAAAQLRAIAEAEVGLADRVKQAELRSPMKATVKRLFFNTIGGVLQPGKEVMELVPLEDTLLLEARIGPQDIGFLRPGQKARVRFTAYDFSIYGGLDGTLDHIAADTVTDDKGNAFYVVRIRANAAIPGEKPLSLIPGMVAEVDILTGKKTVLSYLLKPVLRAKARAFTER